MHAFAILLAQHIPIDTCTRTFRHSQQKSEMRNENSEKSSAGNMQMANGNGRKNKIEMAPKLSVKTDSSV